MSLQPWVMVAKDIFPFKTMTDGCKKFNFMEFFNKIHIFCEILQEVVQPSVTVAKEKYPSQQWLMVAMDIFPFATVTDGCKEADFMGFPVIFLKTSWFLKACIYLWIWQKRANLISHSSKSIPRILNLI